MGKETYVMKSALHKKQELQKPKARGDSLWENWERFVEKITFKPSLKR